jgi:integrase
MQTRPYPKEDSKRVWLSVPDQNELLACVRDDMRREIAVLLGLHGLRSDEIVKVSASDIRMLEGGEAEVLEVTGGKTGKRELPASKNLGEQIRKLKRSAGLTQDEPVVDVGTRALRNWMAETRERLVQREVSDRRTVGWEALGWHDLRRTWATQSYYALAVAGVPVAEQLVLSWGGWRQNETGRSTFRENYLGPVPDQVVASTSGELSLP